MYFYSQYSCGMAVNVRNADISQYGFLNCEKVERSGASDWKASTRATSSESISPNTGCLGNEKC